MLRSLRDSAWLSAYSADFRRRLSRLLGRALRKMPASLALTTLVNDSVKVDKPGELLNTLLQLLKSFWKIPHKKINERKIK